LSMAVKLEEIKNMKGDDKMKALAEKLKVQKRELSKVEKENGFQHGRERAMDFDYVDFKVFEKIKEPGWNDLQGGFGGELMIKVEGALNALQRDFEDLFWEPSDSTELFIDGDMYLEGYVDGVLAVWKEVSKDL
jgi:hypothetical protein